MSSASFSTMSSSRTSTPYLSFPTDTDHPITTYISLAPSTTTFSLSVPSATSDITIIILNTSTIIPPHQNGSMVSSIASITSVNSISTRTVTADTSIMKSVATISSAAPKPAVTNNLLESTKIANADAHKRRLIVTSIALGYAIFVISALAIFHTWIWNRNRRGRRYKDDITLSQGLTGVEQIGTELHEHKDDVLLQMIPRKPVPRKTEEEHNGVSPLSPDDPGDRNTTSEVSLLVPDKEVEQNQESGILTDENKKIAFRKRELGSE